MLGASPTWQGSINNYIRRMTRVLSGVQRRQWHRWTGKSAHGRSGAARARGVGRRNWAGVADSINRLHEQNTAVERSSEIHTYRRCLERACAVMGLTSGQYRGGCGVHEYCISAAHLRYRCFRVLIRQRWPRGQRLFVTEPWCCGLKREVRDEGRDLTEILFGRYFLGRRQGQSGWRHEM